MADPTARLPMPFPDEKRLSSARTARALPSSHLVRERPKLLDVHERILQRAVRELLRRAGIVKRSGYYALPDPFAMHLPEDPYDIRTVQKLLGQKDIRPTMVYTHLVRTSGPGGVMNKP